MPSKLSRTDWLFGLALCVLLQSAWAVQDWANLSVLHLPDTDDMMRLQQIRDWLGGQSWFDLTQHRLGFPPGLAMHWTRVNDLIPALIITVVKPFAGAHGAELAAVLIGPALLFFAFLMLSARATLSLGGAGATKIAILIAALAFPATGMFIPGRIDHHALQIVLLLGAVTAALGGGNARNGALAGVTCALSIVVGLETVPQIVALVMGALVVCVLDKRQRDPKTWFRGFLSAVTLSTFICAISYGGKTLDIPSTCDTMSPTLALLCGLGALSLIIFTYPVAVLRRYRWRIIPGSIATAVVSLAFAASLVPACRSGPYGTVDPFLMRVWMAHVGEALGLFHQASFGILWGYSALVLVALAVAGWRVWRDATHRTTYLLIAAPLGMSVLVMLFQLRGAYIGAGLGAPILAVWLSELRVKGGVALVGAGLLSAGVVHHLLADKLDALLTSAAPQAAPPVQSSLGKASGGAGCTDAATMDALNQLPASTIMAPMDAGAYIIGATPHRVFAAPYHRNNRGNLAMYQFFLATPEHALTEAEARKIDYVLVCADSFSELEGEPGLANSLVGALKSGHAPAWLTPRTLKGSSALFYRVNHG